MDTQVVKLLKPWAGNKKGAKITVDDLRAEWLVSHGFVVDPLKEKAGAKTS